ncbi:uncharacterized protein At2g33490 [Typha latifolia]|uniref:uncharacterized protein At2g33490 n=1 Tax=Typha latifolia TaxID=4733 RepID=UPI003C2B3CFF
MKSSLRKLRGFALRQDPKEKRTPKHSLAHQDELLQATEDMLDMRNCYDSLLSAAAATANSAYEFSESLREMGTCLLEKIALNDDEESGRVLLMLGKVQFELQKLVDSYRGHVIQTITTPSESLLKELQTVEEMKRQCDDKRDLYKFMLAVDRDKGRSRHTKGETFSSEQLQQAQEDYQEEATLFVFRLKSLKQGQFRSLLTQAARHHAAQLSFFRKGFKSLEVVEPHIKVVAEQQHIDYNFRGLADEESDGDDEDDEDDNDDGYDGSDDGELSFDYGQNDHVPDAASVSRNSMEEYLDRGQADFVSSNARSRAGSYSAPLFTDKKSEASERTKEMRPSSTRKLHTYVLPTPCETRSSSLPGSVNPIPQSLLESNKGVRPTQLQHSSPLQTRDLKDNELPIPTRPTSSQSSVLKECNTNSGPTRLPPSNEGLALPGHSPQNASDMKKIKREAFSGPLTSNSSAALPTLVPTPQASTQKVSPGASPLAVSSPKINELHELPRPPTTSSKPRRPPNPMTHSAPLVYRDQVYSRTRNMPSNASPLPTPPGVMARSFSIPSNGQRTPGPESAA